LGRRSPRASTPVSTSCRSYTARWSCASCGTREGDVRDLRRIARRHRYLLVESPKRYIPGQDRGYIVAIPQLPAGSSLERTTEIAKELGRIALEIPGVSHLPTFAGFSGATQTISSSSAAAYVVLKPFEERMKQGPRRQPLLEPGNIGLFAGIRL
jgi:AcrB/AcrD/AcrF family